MIINIIAKRNCAKHGGNSAECSISLVDHLLTPGLDTKGIEEGSMFFQDVQVVHFRNRNPVFFSGGYKQIYFADFFSAT